MLRYTLALLLTVAMLSGCATFYKNPREGEVAGIFIEKHERTAIDWYRHFDLAEIDGLPVSHMFAPSGNNEIRVQPGLRRMVFHVGYLNGLMEGQHRAIFAVQLPVEAGKRYRIGGTVEGDAVAFTITDEAKPDVPWVKLATVGARVTPNMTIGVPGGGVVIVPSRQ